MLKRILTLLTTLFLSGCANEHTYVELDANEFKKELYNEDKKIRWMFVARSIEDNYFYFQKILSDNPNQNSVITVIKSVKVSKNDIKVVFKDDNYSLGRSIEISNIIFN